MKTLVTAYVRSTNIIPHVVCCWKWYKIYCAPTTGFNSIF